MASKLTDWMHKVKRLESAIASRVEGAPRPVASSSARQPLEILHAVLDAIDGEVLPSGRGRFSFPYTQVRVWLAAASPRDKIRLGAAFDGPPSLHERVIERLTRAGCVVSDLEVRVTFVSTAAQEWAQPDFHVDYLRGTPAPAAPPLAVCLELTITHGTAEREVYTFDGASIGSVALGRGSEVRDSRQRLLRTNHVPFADDGEINGSVSRRHARIEHDSTSGSFRLHDDTGGDATSVIRGGRGLQVPRGRGLVLRAGDVVVLGRARVGVTISVPAQS